MANYDELKAAIRAAIYENTEQAITGDALQGILLEMVDDLNDGKADAFLAQSPLLLENGELSLSLGSGLSIYSDGKVGVDFSLVQAAISDLDIIRAGAALGATAYQLPADGIPAATLAAEVQASLAKADASASAADLAATDAKLDTILTTRTVADKFTFPGVNGVISFNPVTLSQAGDALEFRAKCGSSSANVAFAFLHNGDNIGISLHSAQIGVKNASNSWLSGMNGGLGQFNFNSAGAGVISITPKTFKILLTASGLELYIDGTLYHTVSGGTPTVTFDHLGGPHNSSYYWNGELEFFRVTRSGVTTDLLDLPGYATSGDVSVTTHKEADGLLPEVIERTKQPLLVVPVSSTSFQVWSLNSSTDKYLIHEFKRWQGSREIGGVTYQSQDIWTEDKVKDENGYEIYQGNLNFIYKVGTVDGVAASDPSVAEDYHIGPSHGCEAMEFCQFFADGKPIDPTALTAILPCSAFRILIKSRCFVVDSSQDTGNVNNYPKVVGGEMVENGIHYIDALFTADNEQKWYNRFQQTRASAVQYAMICGGMVQGKTAYNSEIEFNDLAVSRNTITSDGSSVTYAAPDGYTSQIINNQYILADTVTMHGAGNIIHQRMLNADNNKQGHANIYTHSNDASSAKCYMNAVLVTGTGTPDTIVGNDVIAVYLERKIELV